MFIFTQNKYLHDACDFSQVRAFVTAIVSIARLLLQQKYHCTVQCFCHDHHFRCVIHTLNRRCREHIPVTVDAEVRALISENTRDSDTAIYTVRSVIHGEGCIWAFTVSSNDRTVKEASDDFSATKVSSHNSAVYTQNLYFFFFNLQDGVFIKGLYLQGAGWDKKNSVLSEANPMQLVCQMPTIQFKPVENKKKGSKGRKLSSLFTKQKELMTMYKSRLQHRIYVKIGASEYYETKLCKHTD